MSIDITYNFYNVAWAGDRISSVPYVFEFVASYGIKRVCEELWGRVAENVSAGIYGDKPTPGGGAIGLALILGKKEWRKLGHPYGKSKKLELVAKRKKIPESPKWLVHQQSGDLLNSLHWNVGFNKVGGVSGKVGHWVETGKSGSSIMGQRLIGDEIENADVSSQKRGVDHANWVMYGTNRKGGGGMIARPYLKETFYQFLHDINRIMDKEIKKREGLSELYSLTRRANTIARYAGISLPVNAMYNLAQKWRNLEVASSFSPISIGHRVFTTSLIGPALGRAQSMLVPFGGAVGSRASRFVNTKIIGRSGIPSRIFGFASPHGVVKKKIPTGADNWMRYL